MPLTNPILRKRLWVHVDEIRSIHFKWSSVLFSINACATAMTTTKFRTPTFPLKIIRTFFTFLSRGLSIRGRPRFFFDSTVLLFFDFTIFPYFFFLRLRTVLSPSWKWDLLNSLSPALAPWMEPYFPISYHSLSVNLMFSRFFFKLFWNEDTTDWYSICPRDVSPCARIISAFWWAKKRQIRYYNIFHLKMLITTIRFGLMEKAYIVA